MPLAIAAPDIAVTLLDSTRKKLDFLAAVVADLGLSNVILRHARAEDAARDPALRERYDCATARAVAPLEVLAEWLLPFVRLGGSAVALKSESIDPELELARPAIDEVGGAPPKKIGLVLPGTTIPRTVVVIEKRVSTPPRFPRPATRAKHRRSPRINRSYLL
jgi:16S rRNA (guanine527-N7)-methyltransferase